MYGETLAAVVEHHPATPVPQSLSTSGCAGYTVYVTMDTTVGIPHPLSR